jgi:hypothetical protein
MHLLVALLLWRGFASAEQLVEAKHGHQQNHNKRKSIKDGVSAGENYGFLHGELQTLELRWSEAAASPYWCHRQEIRSSLESKVMGGGVGRVAGANEA